MASKFWETFCSLKMTAPRYQKVKASEIPETTDHDGTHVRVACGTFWGMKGPVEGVAADPIYWDVSVPIDQCKKLRVETTRHAFAHCFAGSGKFCNASGSLAVPTESVKWSDTAAPSHADNRSLILFDGGNEAEVQVGEDGIRF
jgi:redox-sensitive bicupin YhaK (pirin superfamily)